MTLFLFGWLTTGSKAQQPLFIGTGLAVLEEIKELEQRPAGSPGEWAEDLPRKNPARSLVLGESVERGPGDRMSADEREVRAGGVQERLIRLAVTSRISKDEYDGLARRLQGN
jgi:hypothetical protein